MKTENTPFIYQSSESLNLREKYSLVNSGHLQCVLVDFLKKPQVFSKRGHAVQQELLDLLPETIRKKRVIMAGSPAPQVLPIWGLAIPLPAIMMIVVSLYMLVVGVGLWIRCCVKDRCSTDCNDCCPSVSIWEQCFRLAQMCDCRMPTLHSCLNDACSSQSCDSWDCACVCQPPECDTCNCLCFEIRIK